MMHSAMRPKKKKKKPLTDSGSATALCFDLGGDNTASDHMRSH